MATTTRTRSMSPILGAFLESHVQNRKLRLQAGEPMDVNKIQEDGEMLIQYGKELLEIAKEAKAKNPEPEDIEAVKAKYEKELAELRSKLPQVTQEVKKRGRRAKVS